jgi:TusA-related sulfurtransferase
LSVGDTPGGLGQPLPSPGQPPAAAAGASPTHLDLRGTPCPLNYVRSRLALEKLPPGGLLVVDLDPGEPERMVADGLRGEGHAVENGGLVDGSVRLSIRRG